MTTHIHVIKENMMKSKPSSKKGTFAGNKVSHMEIDCNKIKPLNMTI
jgi:hypothetical protein